jgi:hypothetical protein
MGLFGGDAAKSLSCWYSCLNFAAHFERVKKLAVYL